MSEHAQFHLVGVGGVGMSALAQLLLDLGYRVSGSDRFYDQGVDLPVLETLQRGGLKLFPQNGSGVSHSQTTVVLSTAIEAGNPDWQKAMAVGCRVVHRASLLAELSRGQKLVAITGTSGKSTVTGMIGWILETAGWDPTVVNGAPVVGWEGPARVGSVRKGTSPYWVVEADESDRSLLHFEPEWAVITTVSRDHFTVSEAVELFTEFARMARAGVVVGPRAIDFLSTDPTAQIRWYAAPDFQPKRTEGGWAFTWAGATRPAPGLGYHQAENAFVAALTCQALGVPDAAIVRGIETFRGIGRRLQVIGTAKGVTVVDDYAHNPEKISAAWRAVSEQFPRVLGIWRPHGFAPLRNMMDGLIATFVTVCRSSDRLFLLPVFYAGGTADRSVSSDDLAMRLRDRGVEVGVVADYPELMSRLRGLVREGDVVLFMGARDPALPIQARHFLDLLANS